MNPFPNPYQITRDFEQGLCLYTGSRFAVAVNSCTAALMLACAWFLPREVQVPRHTYCSVPQAIIRGGHTVSFTNDKWSGAYQLQPLPIWDSARRFTSGMYISGQYQCVSFAAAKILGIEQGGAILHDNEDADVWFRRMRFDGRTEGLDPFETEFKEVAHHCIMLPSIAAQGLLRLHHLPQHNEDMPDYAYPDLSKFDWNQMLK